MAIGRLWCNMRDFFFHIFARKRNALGVRAEFSGYRSAQSESAVLADLCGKYEHITVLEIRERKPCQHNMKIKVGY